MTELIAGLAPLGVAVQVYSPARDVDTFLIVRTLKTFCPLVMGSNGVGVTPGPFHWKSGVSVSPVRKVTEQLRVTVSPATMEEEEMVSLREMGGGSGGNASYKT